MQDFKRLLTLIVLFQTCTTSLGFIVKYLHKYGEDFATSFVLPVMIYLIIITKYLFKKLNGETDNTKIWSKINNLSIFALCIFYYKLLFVDFLKHIGIWVIPVSVIIAFSLRLFYEVEDEEITVDEKQPEKKLEQNKISKIPQRLKEAVGKTLTDQNWKVSGDCVEEKGYFDAWDDYSKDNIKISFHTTYRDESFFDYDGPKAEFTETDNELMFRIPGIDLEVKMCKHAISEKTIAQRKDELDLLIENSSKKDAIEITLEPTGIGIFGILSTLQKLSWKTEGKSRIKTQVMGIYGSQSFRKGAHTISLHMSDYTDEITIHGTATAIRKALLEVEAAKKVDFSSTYTLIEGILKNEESKVVHPVSLEETQERIETKPDTVYIKQIPNILKIAISEKLRVKGWKQQEELDEDKCFNYWVTFSNNNIEVTFVACDKSFNFFSYNGPKAIFSETDDELIFRIHDIDLEVNINKHSVSEESESQIKEGLVGSSSGEKLRNEEAGLSDNLNCYIQVTPKNSAPFVCYFQECCEKISEVTNQEKYAVYAVGESPVLFCREPDLIEGFSQTLREIKKEIETKWGFNLGNFEKRINEAEKKSAKNTLLSKASENEDLATVKFICKNSFEIKDGKPALINALKKAHVEIIKELVNKGVPVNSDAPSLMKTTPLLLASKKCPLEVIEFLVENGARLSDCNKEGETPILAAAKTGHLETVKYLHSKGASVNEKNKNNYTALMAALDNEHYEIAKYLVENEANIFFVEKKGKRNAWEFYLDSEYDGEYKDYFTKKLQRKSSFTLDDIPREIASEVCTQLKIDGWEYENYYCDDKGFELTKSNIEIVFSTRSGSVDSFVYFGPEASYVESEKEFTFKIPEIDLEVIVNRNFVEKIIPETVYIQRIPHNLKNAISEQLRLKGWQQQEELEEDKFFRHWVRLFKDSIEITFESKNKNFNLFTYKGPKAKFTETDEKISFKIPEISLFIIQKKDKINHNWAGKCLNCGHKLYKDYSEEACEGFRCLVSSKCKKCNCGHVVYFEETGEKGMTEHHPKQSCCNCGHIEYH